MPAQKREARKNYIDLVGDASEPHEPVGAEAALVPPLKEYLLRLVDGILRARDVAR